MKKILIIAILWLPELLSASQAEIGLELLPKGRPFRRTFADPREIKMALAFEGDSRILASIGNYFSLFSIRPVNDGNWDLHFGLEGAGYFSMKKAEDQFPLETADGLLGAYVEGKLNWWQWQVRLQHISAHLADGTQAQGDGTPYSREVLTVRHAAVPIEQLQLYAGVSYLVNSHPQVDRWIYQLGLNAFLPAEGQVLVPFLGSDVKWRQDSPHNPALSLQFGVALNNPPESYRSFRFFYQYYTGGDNRGKFFAELITTHAFGIEMQI